MADLPRSPTGDMDYGAMVQSLQSAQPSSTDPDLAGLPPELMRSVNALISQRQGGTRQEGAPFQDAADPLGSAMLALGFIGPRFGGVRGPTPMRAPAGEGGGAPPSGSPVQKYTEQLSSVQRDNAAFDSLVEQLRNDRSITHADMKAIAENFLGTTFGKFWKTRGSTLDTIVNRQALNARQEARGASHDRQLKPWGGGE